MLAGEGESLSQTAKTAIYKDTNLKKCANCKAVYYCSKECQVQDWKGHKSFCKAAQHVAKNCTDKGNPVLGFAATEDDGPQPATKEYKGPVALRGKYLAGKKGSKMINASLTPDQLRVFGLVGRMVALQTILSDTFSREDELLPPRPSSYTYAPDVDAVAYGDDDDQCDIWDKYTASFKSWIWRATSEGRVFDFKDKKSLMMLDELKDCLAFAREHQPTAEIDWKITRLSVVVINILSSVANQAVYLQEIIAPDGKLHDYVDFLFENTTLCFEILEMNHLWIGLMQLMFSSVLVGVEFMETVYRTPIEKQYLDPFEVIAQKMVLLAAKVTKLEVWEPNMERYRISNAKFMINDFMMWMSNAGGREFRGILRAKKLFPSLDISPVAEIARHYQQQVESYFEDNFAKTVVLANGASVWAEILDCI